MSVMHLQPAAPPPEPRAQGGRWHWTRLLSAPHRLAFFAGACAMALTGLWWALALTARAQGWAWPWAVAPLLAHGALLSLAFMPLFIVGFLFTAGPRWLGQPEVPAAVLLRPVLAMVGGGALTLLGVHVHGPLAALGLGLQASGWAKVLWRFAHLVRDSRVPDRVHAQAVLGAGCFGLLAWAGLAAAWALDAPDLARAAVQLALWGFLAPTFAVVSHRMLPFFSASVLPQLEAWRPHWLLSAMGGALAASALVAMADALWGGWPAPLLAAAAGLQAAASGLMLWLAVRWGLLHSLRGKALRLLAMLHGGFVWLGLALGLAAASNGLQALGLPGLGLAPLHALTVGYLGCTLIAMITRVSAGHSGRPLAVDALAWGLYGLLQGTAVARVLAALWPAMGGALTLAAALGWAVVTLAWAGRHGAWLGRPRVDGRPG
ncbi:NnrS family protein [Inhella crocodyli]|uniref:NnrS family protein n=1 Tax=Inhella crocodyli TaxID=2499851 RepID=A0A437LTH8_9BURK|nr:NnrS family protein [Inhella crocodyli]RVT88719.1 NnrS family protein [Inhella crocodyli]